MPTVTLQAPSFSVDVHRFGEGEIPLLILPGASVLPVIGSAPAVESAYAAFGKTHTVFLCDYRRVLPEGFTVDDLAKDVLFLMDELSIGRADVLGCSLGGMVGQVLAEDHPERVRRLALGSTLSRPNETSRSVCERWLRLAENADPTALNRDFAGEVYSPAFYAQFKDAFAAMEKTGSPEDLARFSVQTAAFGAFDRYDALSEIRCPALVIGSWGDRILTGEASVEIAQKLRCALVMYASYGHAVYDEAPDVKDRLISFFNF